MSQYYNAKRSRNLFNPHSKDSFSLSRSRIDLFLQCPRCFYLDRRLGVDRPPSFPFTLNSAVDVLLKQEFDIHRAKGEPHPLMRAYGVDAIPLAHEKLDAWRDTFTGVQYFHKESNFLIFGAIDDVWVTPQGEYLVVDYKATSTAERITGLNKPWHDGYKRQMEIYQWLFRKNGYAVSSTGYFVYCNGKKDVRAFDGKLEFDITLIPYQGDDGWVEKTIYALSSCLRNDVPPIQAKECDYCAYRGAAEGVLSKQR